MRIALPGDEILEIWLDVRDGLYFPVGSKILFFPNKSPLSSIKAILDSYSYETYVTPSKKVAYKLKAKFNSKKELINSKIKIGDKGTAKIYGEKVTLAFYLFRRPISSFRQWVGW